MAAGCSLRAKILGELMFQGARLFATTVEVHSEGEQAVLAYKREHRPIVFVGWHGHDVIHLTAHRILFGRSAPAVIMVLDDANGRVLQHFGRRLNLPLRAAAESTRDLAGPRSGISTMGPGRSDHDRAPAPGLRRHGGGGRAPRAAAQGQGGGRFDRTARQRRHRAQRRGLQPQDGAPPSLGQPPRTAAILAHPRPLRNAH